MRQTSITRFWFLLFLLLVATACSKEAPSPSPSNVGTVALAATSSPATCGAAPSTCILYPDRDTTVYGTATTKDFGKGHELCAGLSSNAANGVARPLMHFDLAALPLKSIVTAASLSLSGRRGAGTSTTLSLYRLTSGSWSEGSGTSVADGHNAGGCAFATCNTQGACGWAATGTPSGAGFANSNDVNIFTAPPVTSSAFTVAAAGTTTVTFSGLASHVRTQAAGSNFGWTIRVPNETVTTTKLVFYSSDTASGDSNKPSLHLTYSKGPGSSCTFDSDCVFSDGTSGDCAGGFCCTATCNDNKSCTTDSCNSSGTCSNTPNNAACNDSRSCTTDSCSPLSGSADPTTGCVITPVDAACNDSKSCTADTCNPSSGSANATTGCVITPSNAACDDSKSCTADTCNPSSGSANATTGCVNATNDAACSDGKTCTTDTCNPSSGSANATTGCVNTAVDAVCNDSNGCTTDTCSPSSGGANATTGCLIVNNSAPCDDLVFCDGADTCNLGSCSLHNGNPCTVDPSDSNCATSCNEAADNCTAPDAIGTGCNNGVFCDGTDSCNGAGSCAQHSGNPCSVNTADANCSTSCNEAADNCTAPDAIGTGCNNGLFCDGTDSCDGAGSCSQHIGNPCTVNTSDANCSTSCNEVSDNCTSPDPDGTGCNNSVYCDGTDTCSGGSCSQHAGDPCLSLNTSDANCKGSCNEGAKNCTANDPDTTGCNDGKTCTAGESCHSGVCNGGGALDCSGSADQCHSGVCNEPGGCAANPLTGNSCNDSNACTSSDACQSGTCTGSAVNCNDNNPCTTDSCNSGSGCVHTAVADGTSCGSDGNVCTLDTCLAGVCHAPVANGTACGSAASCSGAIPSAQAIPAVTCASGVCPAQNPVACGATTPCNAAGTACQGTCGADTDCPSGFYCDSTSHACTVQVGVGATCARTAMCTQSGQALTCVDSVCCTSTCGGGVTTDCQTCNGSSPGTCTPQTGTSCNDSVFCNGADTCAAGVCNVHVGDPCPLNTTDGNCSASCNEGAKNCTAPDVAGTGCTDSNACTTSDQCNGSGTCSGGPAPTCNDNNPCTNDSCAPATGCVFTVSNSNTCSDGDACTTGDHCSGGNCVSSGPTNCNDNNACTDDSCNGGSGCANVANTNPCNDNNACTTNDVCANKACVGGPVLTCDDKNPCTDDSCAPATGCVFTNDNANTCSDSNACTSTDHCASGKCVGTTVTCNDSNPCTDDSCDTGTGCIFSNNTSACDDANACTTSDRCAGGKCVGGAAPTCNDGNPCTLDNCDPAKGCVFPAGNAGTRCRASAGICDPAESCDGVNSSCPANQFDKTSTCSAPSCTNGTETRAAVCNGSGAACPTAAQKSCAPYTCSATACSSTCATDTDCAPGNYCAVGGKCTPKAAIGASCSAGAQCLSSFCADGVCCNSDCSNQCEACNLPTSAGTCTAVMGKPVGSRPGCPGDATGCDGFCNGSVRTSCTLPGQNTECRTASCDAGKNTATLREFCDGQGSCPGKRTQDCTPGICGATQCTGCSTNADCPKGDFCRGGVCKPLASNGTACSIDPECSSAHCVDGVCCDNDCTGQCEACNLPAAPGTCTAIGAGQSPATGRPACNGTTGSVCGGTCDGTNRRACVYAGPGVVCRDADCQNAVATLVAFCDGAGSCPALDQITCPVGSTCSGTLCVGGTNNCSSDGDCNANQYCAAGACVSKKHPGETCNSASECNSSVCIDGVCCSSACTGQCEACNLVGDEGTCLPVTGAPHGGRQPCTTDGSVCGGTCDGVTNDRCAYKGAGTSCRDAQCHGGLADLAATCQGNGSCAPLQQQSCDPVGCDAEAIACAGPCKTDGDCMTGQYCSASMCVGKLANGSPCGGSNQCTNGHCVDAVCCDSACAGQCQSCDQAGSLGTCSAVPGAPRDGRPACPGSGACGGYCDGTDGTSCVLPDANITCGVEYCSESADTKAPRCNGNATCVMPPPLSCDPYRCDPQGSTCLTSCEMDSDCAPGLVCNNGGCSQPIVVPDAGTKPDAGMGMVDGSIGAGGASAGGASSVDAGTRGSGGSSSGGKGGGPGSAGTGTSGAAGTVGIPSPDGGVIAVDAGVDGGARPGGKHNNEHDSGGCGCRVTGTRAPDGAVELAAIGLAAMLVRRRRRRAPAQYRM